MLDPLRSTATKAQSASRPRRPRLRAPDRDYEHVPLRRVPLTAYDAETLAAAARVCQQALADPNQAQPQQRLLLADLRELLESIDRVPACDARFGTQLAALTGLAALTAEPVGDLEQLARLLVEAGQNDLVLSDEAEKTYHRVAAWMHSTLSGGDPLERWAW